jgi:2-iminobutanoate/2-iminopropanoate deaminase
MSKALIKHPGASVNTGNYSPGLVCDGWLYISGQGSIDLASGKVVGTTIEEQTRQTLRNVQSILNAAGCTMDDVVQCTCYLADMGDWPIFNEVYAEFFSGILPTRTTVGAALGDILVEISAVAKIPKAKPAHASHKRRTKKVKR